MRDQIYNNLHSLLHPNQWFFNQWNCGDSAPTCISEWLKNTKTVSFGCRASDEKTGNDDMH